MGKPRRECETSTDWRATFEENERRLLELTYSATPAQRLDWLEEALELAYRVGANQNYQDLKSEVVLQLQPTLLAPRNFVQAF